MKARLLGALVIAFHIAAFPATASAASDHLVISELQTATSSSASQEFIELYNPSALEVPIDGWTIEYKSATSTDVPASWVKHATLTGTIKSYGFYLIAPKSYLTAADTDWGATLAGSGGTVRLKDAAGAIIDRVGYGSTANAAEGNSPAPAPAAGHSIERLPGRMNEAGGNSVDTDLNGSDFVERDAPQPQSTASALEIPSLIPVEAPDIELAPEPDVSPEPASYPTLQITELLVDPVSPLTDTDDEFIEVFNPNDATVELKGYTLKSGSNFHSYYIFTDGTIQPHSYLPVYSRESGLGLTNSGGAAEILDPSGVVMDIAATYGVALPGQSWAKFDDGWHWTPSVTPGMTNVISAQLPASATKKATSAKPKTATAKKTTSKAKAAAKPKAKTPKVQTAKAKLPTYVAAARNMKPQTWLLITLAVLTIGYAAYEFRYDLYNFYNKLRGNPPARSPYGPPTERGSGD